MVLILFTFLLFHQADKMVISPLVTPIMEEFQINEAQMGAISSLALVVAAFLYPFWGYFYDRHARPKALALTSLIWGITTSLSAVAPNFRAFMITRASTGIDDSSHSGLYSLLSDYFGPKLRGRLYGFMHTAGPLGFMLGTILATTLGRRIGWRNVFLVTGGVGVVTAFLIFFIIRDPPRGSAEPELRDLKDFDEYRINWPAVRDLLKNRSLLLLTLQGFFGVIPWNVLTFWFFRYLETERGYTSGQSMLAMLVVITSISLGFLFGGNLGDRLFERFKLGRVAVAGAGIVAGAVLFYLTLTLPIHRSQLFLVLIGLTGFSMSVPSPNVTAILHDITLPEVRSMAGSLRKLFEDGGTAVAPFLAGVIATKYSLGSALLVMCTAAWLIGLGLFWPMLRILPQDIDNLRETMRERAVQETMEPNGAADLDLHISPQKYGKM